MSKNLPVFRKILLMTSSDEPEVFSLKFAKRLFDSDPTREFKVVSYAEKLPFYTSIPSEERRVKLQALLVEDVHQKTRAHCDPYLSKYELVVHEGRDLDAVVEEIKKFEPDLVIKNEDHVDGLFEKGATSGFDLKLARQCPAPLLLLDSEFGEDSAVACAIDPEPDDSSRDELCSRIFDFAAAMANLSNSDLFAVRAWRALGEQLLASRDRMSEEELSEYVDSIEKNLKKQFDLLLEKKRDLVTNEVLPEFHKGDALPVITHIIKNKKVGLVVMGSVARKGLQGYLMGNTSETLVQAAPCSVLIVKPDNEGS